MSFQEVIGDSVGGMRGESQADILRRTGLFGVQLGDTDEQAIGKLNANAAESAAFAEEFSGPAYDTISAGQTATAVGHFFRVWNGDTPRTYKRYQRTAGGSAEADPLASSAVLAAPNGALLVNGSALRVRSIAALLAIAAARLRDGQAAIVSGYYDWSPGSLPKGGGSFHWDANSTQDANGGAVIQIPGFSTGRWIRQINDGQINLYEMGCIADGVSDCAVKIRAHLALGLKIVAHEEPLAWGLSQAISQGNDTFDFKIRAVGRPKFKLTSPYSNTNSNLNVFARLGEFQKSFEMEGEFDIEGNWTPDTVVTGSNGIGIWLRPNGHCIAKIGRVWAHGFAEYGVLNWCNRAEFGYVEAFGNRYQGFAITNVFEFLKAGTIMVYDNGLMGFDLETTTGRGPVRNVEIGQIISRNNGEYGVGITTGRVSQADMEADPYGPLSYRDYNIKIGTIRTNDNMASGVIIDFPNVKIGEIIAEGDAVGNPTLQAGLLMRNLYGMEKGDVEIGSVITNGCKQGAYFTGMANARYKNVKIGYLENRNNVGAGSFVDSDGFSSILIDTLKEIGNGSVSSDNNNRPFVSVGSGQFQGTIRKYLQGTSTRIAVPPGPSAQTTYVFGAASQSASMVERIIVNVAKVDTGGGAPGPRLRIRMGGTTLGDVRCGVLGPRVFDIMENKLQAQDTSNNPIGVRIASPSINLESLAGDTWVGDGEVTVDVIQFVNRYNA